MGTESGPNKYTFPQELYRGGNLSSEVSQQMTAKRPFVYVPVNLDQARKVEEYYYAVANGMNLPQEGWYAERWRPEEAMPDGSANPLASLTFPPARYDDFVLIGVSPGVSTCGLVTPPNKFIEELRAANVPAEDWYHVLGLRTYFLANRDVNKNGLLDFHYQNRTRLGEAKPGSYNLPNMNLLPDGTNGYGPYIYLRGKSLN